MKTKEATPTAKDIKQQLAKTYLELHVQEGLIKARKAEIGETLCPLIALESTAEDGKQTYEKIEIEGYGYVSKYNGNLTKSWTKEGEAQKTIWEENTAKKKGWFTEKRGAPYVKAGGTEKAK